MIAALLALTGAAAATSPVVPVAAQTSVKKALPASKRLSPAQQAFLSTPYVTSGVALPPWVDARGRLLRQVWR